MSGIKGALIDSLRDGAEGKAVWELRKSFLNRNLEPHMYQADKEHIIYLSRAFIDIALHQSQDFPSNVVQEVYQRSWGMSENIQNAAYELGYQSGYSSYNHGNNGSTNSSWGYSNNAMNSSGATQNYPGTSYPVSDLSNSWGNTGTAWNNSSTSWNNSGTSFPTNNSGAFSMNNAGNSMNSSWGSFPMNNSATVKDNSSPARNNSGTFKSKSRPKLHKDDDYSNARSIVPAKKCMERKGKKRKYKGKGAPKARKFARQERRKAQSTDDFDSIDIENGPQNTELENTEIKICRMVPGPAIASFQWPAAKPLHQGSKKSVSSKQSENTRQKSTTSTDQSQAAGEALLASIGKSSKPSLNDRTREQKELAAWEETNTSSNKIIPGNKDLVLKDREKLQPIMDVAKFYSRMENKDANEPFNTLKKCAIETRNKLKFENKRIVSKDGAKSISCSVIVGDICVANIVVPLGTSPDKARQLLASTTLEKICLPYLQLVSDGSDGLQLEASKNPFGEGGIKGEAVPEKGMAAGSGFAEKSKSCNTVTRGRLDGEECGIETDVSSCGQEQVTHASPVEPPQTMTPTPATECTQFNSYLAWTKEEHPTMESIRYLGHLYTTLPYADLDASIILKFLSNVSGIRLDMFPAQLHSKNSDTYTFNIVMGRKILLTVPSSSSSSDNEQEAIEFACEDVLRKVSMPYLCLKSNTLFGSVQPFVRLSPEKCVSEGIIYDTWSAGEVRISEYAKNRVHLQRFPRFFLMSSGNKPFSTTMLQSGRCQHRSLKMATIKERGKDIRIMKLDGKEIGRTYSNLSGRKTTRMLAAEIAFRNLRACHWLMFEVKKPPRPKTLLAEHMIKYLPGRRFTASSSDVLSSSSASTSQEPMAQLGAGDEGMGKSASDNSKSSAVYMPHNERDELGFYKSVKGPNKHFVRANLLLTSILQAFSNSPYIHNPLFLPRVAKEDITKDVYNLAQALKINLAIKGGRFKSIVIRKKTSPSVLFYNVLKAGGHTEFYKLIPPQRKPNAHLKLRKTGKTGNKPGDYIDDINTFHPKEEAPKARIDRDRGCIAEIETRNQKGRTMISRGVQCNLIPAPPLVKFTKVEIIRDYEDRQTPWEEWEEEGDEDEKELEEDSDFGSDKEED